MSTYQCGEMAALAYRAPNIRPELSPQGYGLVSQTATQSGYCVGLCGSRELWLGKSSLIQRRFVH
jgi:hypothetical protein